MANTKISALAAGSALAGTEVYPIVQSATTVKATAAQMATYVGSNLVIPKGSGSGIKVDQSSATYPWRDIIGNITPKTTGAGVPTRRVYNGGTLAQLAFAANDLVDFEFHIPHDYVPGTDLYFHVHWSHNGTNISGSAVFDFYYSYSKGHNQANFPAEKQLTISYDTTNIATTPQYRHRVDEAAITSDGGSATLTDRASIEVDGLLVGSLKLTTLPTITGGYLFIHTCDLHYQSTNMGTKAKAPDFWT